MKDDRVYLEQILDCTRNIREFMAGMDSASFLKDRKTQSAVILQLALTGNSQREFLRK
jgi:uncharacterized protein with HEPN domain